MKDYTNEMLWENFLLGKEDAFEELYKRFYPPLYSYGYRMTGNNMLVNDAIQNLFINIFQNKHKLSIDKNIRTYLFRAFRNQLLNILHAEQPAEDISLYENLFSIDESDILSSIFPQWNDDLQRQKKLLKALSLLKPNQKEILYLFYVRELSHHEISIILSINYQSSKNLLSRSLLRLRKIYFSL